MNYLAIIDETVAFSRDEMKAEFDMLDVEVKLETCVAEFAAKAAVSRLRMGIAAGVIDDYVIFTNDPVRYVKNAVTNNVIDCRHIDVAKAAKHAKWVFAKFGREHPMQDNIWFIADPHFSHANIIKYCHRPFADVNEMDATLVENWNAKVKKDDVVWCLGDFALGRKENVGKFVS